MLKDKVRVLVVGCGSNRSAIAAGLPYLHPALLAYGHPEGIHVTLLDPDVISATNCVRQPFSQSEIGLYKTVVLANRLNLFWGLDWQGIPERLDPKRRLDGVDTAIGCVDTRKARAAIAQCAPTRAARAALSVRSGLLSRRIRKFVILCRCTGVAG